MLLMQENSLIFWGENQGTHLLMKECQCKYGSRYEIFIFTLAFFRRLPDYLTTFILCLGLGINFPS